MMEKAMNKDRVKLLVRGLYDTQKLRIQLELRIKRLIREGIMTEKESKDFFSLSFEKFQEAEKIMERKAWKDIKDMPIVADWLIHVKGIGPRLSGLLIANLFDISRFDTVSKLWAYAGLHVKDGKSVRRQKNEQSNWNSELKTTCWKIAESFVKTKGPYRELYDDYKNRIVLREVARGSIVYSNGEPIHYQDENQLPAEPPKNPEWTLGRINNMALRYIVKRFLAHLWQVWREKAGLEIRTPYCVEYLGHQSVDDPWDFIESSKKICRP
jgi:hypothetical protein